MATSAAFEAAEKFFFSPASNSSSRQALGGAGGKNPIPAPERSHSPGEAESSIGDTEAATTADGSGGLPSAEVSGARRRGGSNDQGTRVWLRRHVKKNIAGDVYKSHDSFLNRVRPPPGVNFSHYGSNSHLSCSQSTLAPLFEDPHHTSLSNTFPRDTRSSHLPYSTRLAASDANLSQLRRYNTSLTLFPGSGPGESGYFNSGRRGSEPKPKLRMATMGATRLFGSSPQLAAKIKASRAWGNNKDKLPEIKGGSVPADINLTVTEASTSKLPNISDNNLTTNGEGGQAPKRRRRRRKVKRLNVPAPGSKTSSSQTGSSTLTGSEATNSSGTLATSVSGSVQHHKADSSSGGQNDDDDDDEFTDGSDYDDTLPEEEANCIIDPYEKATTTTESAYIPPDSPDSQRKDAERAAEEEVKHNWLLGEEAKSRQRRFESRCNRLTIRVSDEDTVDAIEDRLEELRMMAKPRKDERSVLDRLSDEQRERILRMNEIPIATLRKGRRKGWKDALIMAKTVKAISKPIHKLRWACSMISLLSRGVKERRQYVNRTTEMGGQMRRRLESAQNPDAQKSSADHGSPDKPSLGLDLLLALTTRPHLRTNKTVKRILWLLRATKAFKNLFPAEMEMELAKVVGYERYDDGRIITKQGRAPNRFYYIISGKIGLYRQYQLSTGQVTKGMGFLTKGMTTDPEMMEKQQCREDSLVAKGQVEVLIVDKDAFSYLQHTTVGPPLDFLRSLDLFEEFPVERFTYSPDAIEYTYYGNGKIIVKDSNRTPWLHIVKSGNVKVVRSQSVIDARASNESKFVTPRIEALGCGKPFSHANAMLGVQAKQRKLKTTAQVQLPQSFFLTRGGKKKVQKIYHEEPLVGNPFGQTLGVESLPPPSTKSPPAIDRPITSQRRSVASSKSKRSRKSAKKPDEGNEEGQEKSKEEKEEDENKRKEKEGEDKEGSEEERSSPNVQEGEPQKSPPPGDPGTDQPIEEVNEEHPVDELQLPDADATKSASAQKRRRKDATLPIINIPTRDPGETFNPHPMWLTRERTEETTGVFIAPDQKRSKEQTHRNAYLQLGVLGPGDVFCKSFFPPAGKENERQGLDHMQAALASEPQGVVLLSDGAEVIKISKRFFLQNAGNNTMLKVETMCNEYISEEEAQQVLFDKETWSQYKHALWERMTAELPPQVSIR